MPQCPRGPLMGSRLHTHGMGGLRLYSAQFRRLLFPKNQSHWLQSTLSSSSYTKPMLEICSDKMLVRNWDWLHNRLGLDHDVHAFSGYFGGFRTSFYRLFPRNKNGMIWRRWLEHTVLLFRIFHVWYISPISNHLSVTQTCFWEVCSSVSPKLITFLKSSENSEQKLCSTFLLSSKQQRFWEIIKWGGWRRLHPPHFRRWLT